MAPSHAKPTVVLLCCFKHRLPHLLSPDAGTGADLITDPPTDVQFLFLIRRHLVRSQTLSHYNLLLATRADLQVVPSPHATTTNTANTLRIHSPVHLTLNPTASDVDYPSPDDAALRMHKYAGAIINHSRCPINIARLISSYKTIPSVTVDARSTMVFDFSEDEPARKEHVEQYRYLIDLFHQGRVQTNPYFIVKSECFQHYGFSSSKNIPYIVCADGDGDSDGDSDKNESSPTDDILIPGIITADVDRAVNFMRTHGKVVLKLQDGTGGSGISFFDADDMTCDADKVSKFRHFFEFMLNKQTHEDITLGIPRRGLVLQKFLRGIARYGDTRVHLINGKVCLIGQRRIPKANCKLANVKAGASFQLVVLNDAEVRVCVEFARRIDQYRPIIGSSHIGVDLLKDDDKFKPLVSEVNTWNICFIAETCDFLSCFDSSECTSVMYEEYEAAMQRYRTSDLGKYILHSADIADEVVGKYLSNLSCG